MIVLDASALLAFMFKETGHEVVAGYLDDCCISSVNLLEVASRFSRDGLPVAPVLQLISGLGINIIPFEEAHILSAAMLATAGKEYGLSQADRICLGLGMFLSLPVLTADKVWLDAGLEVEVVVFR
jgi:PIN domain nuclease of toxin-antitoxin system